MQTSSQTGGINDGMDVAGRMAGRIVAQKKKKRID